VKRFRTITRSIILVALCGFGWVSTATGADTIEFRCPPRSGDHDSGKWVALPLESELLSRRPELIQYPTYNRATLVGEWNTQHSATLPELRPDVERKSASTFSYRWDDLLVLKEVYVACVYKASPRVVLRQPLPNGVATCRTKIKRSGEYLPRMVCERA
jgi:hypothetical protein